MPAVSAERDRPRVDPSNVLWFAGAYAIAPGSYGLLETLPDSNHSLWILIAALALFGAYAVGAILLLRATWWVPGGLATALAVAMVRGGFRHLVVTEGGDIAGILSVRDVVRCWTDDGAICEVPESAGLAPG